MTPGALPKVRQTWLDAGQPHAPKAGVEGGEEEGECNWFKPC